ncbi:MAG TPA: flavodoxin family protein, partial [Arthrobacter sp.]|nr:flavodoxin family protein [Arthrobacter sp.]
MEESTVEPAGAPADYSDLKAVFFNGTLKKSPQTSNTDGLIRISRLIME